MKTNGKDSYVVIEHAKPLNYTVDYVALPDDYGKASYFQREDVKEIRRAVFDALDKLNEKIDLADEIKGRHVIIKPNLVGFYHKSGYDRDDMPETTDPRVFEAVVDYMTRFTRRITIAESAGGGMATTAYYKITGLDKVARRYGCDIVAFEFLPIDRYMVPKAEVMKEVAVPRLLSEVIRGEAYYVSVPKMKTNLYTGVTLGFKNAMGTIPAKLRYRNHSYQIEKKLVDLLYLFKPDLTVIDGIVGAEGLTPGPVDPVDSRMIVASNQSVEADRITTDMMGFNSDENELIKEADRRGFGDRDGVTIIGEPRYLKFRPADRSLISERFKTNFPKVRILIGQTVNDKREFASIDEITPEVVASLETACNGGCRPAVAQAFEMYLYAPKIKNTCKDMEFAIIYGHPIEFDGVGYYFDSDAKAYTKDDIVNLGMKTYALGECARCMSDVTTLFTGGCCNIGAATGSLGKVSGASIPMLSPANKGLGEMAKSIVAMLIAKYKLIQAGEYVDLPYDEKAFDKVYPIPELSEEDMQKDWLEWPLPPYTKESKKAALKQILQIM